MSRFICRESNVEGKKFEGQKSRVEGKKSRVFLKVRVLFNKSFGL